MLDLNLIVSNRLEKLADACAKLLFEPFSGADNDPLVPDTILIQSKGMQRWLTLAIAAKKQICANVVFPFPNTFLESLYRQIIGRLPRSGEFDPDTLTLRIFDLLPTLLDNAAHS